MGRVRACRGTLIALLVGALFKFTSWLYNFDLFEKMVEKMAYVLSRPDVEQYEIDEIFFVGLIVLIGIFNDIVFSLFRARQRREVAIERIKAMRSTMSGVHDIVNNFLNNLLYFRLQAELSKALDPALLDLLDREIEVTAAKLQNIDEIEVIAERKLGHGISSLNITESSRKNPD